MIEGRGKIVDPHTVSVAGKNYTVCPLYLQRLSSLHIYIFAFIVVDTAAS